jgi:hypothetical protein
MSVSFTTGPDRPLLPTYSPVYGVPWTLFLEPLGSADDPLAYLASRLGMRGATSLLSLHLHSPICLYDVHNEKFTFFPGYF